MKIYINIYLSIYLFTYLLTHLLKIVVLILTSTFRRVPVCGCRTKTPLRGPVAD